MNLSCLINRKRSSQTFAAGITGMAAISTAVAQPLFQVTDLGVLAGHASSVATRLNDNGDVVGYCAPAVENFNQTAFVWRSGTMSAVGKLPGGSYSYAAAINSSGVIVGDGDTGNIRPQGWIKTSRGLLNFFPNNGGNTHALFVGENGWIGGYYTKSLGGWVSSWKGAIWTVDPKSPDRYRSIDLPILPGGIDPKSSYALPAAFNQSGQAAGSAQTDQIGQHACFWNNDAKHTIVDLGVFPDDWSSVANGMNDLGQVVGSSHPPFSSRAVIWNSDPQHSVSELPVLSGDNYGSAWAINNLGQVVGYSAFGMPGTWEIGPSTAVLWTEGGVFALQSLLEPATGAGWSIIGASAINNSGQIVGTGTHNGQTRAFLLTPITP